MKARLLNAKDILVRHVIERHLRQGTPAQCLEDDRVPRMTNAAWVDSCQLTRGVSSIALDFLEVLFTGRINCRISPVDARCYECGWPAGSQGIPAHPRCGDDWRRHTYEDLGLERTELRPFARPLTLKQACAREAITLDYGKRLLAEAIDCVVDCQLRKAQAA